MGSIGSYDKNKYVLEVVSEIESIWSKVADFFLIAPGNVEKSRRKN